MAMEIEYMDIDDELGINGVNQGEVDAAAMVNGDGMAEVDQVAQIAPPLVDIPASQIYEDQGQSFDDVIHQKHSEEYFMARFQAEVQHERDIAEHKEAHTLASLAREQAEAIYKDAKAEEKAALSALSNLIRRGPQYPPDPSQASAIDQAVSSGGERSAITLDDPDADQTWRTITTLSLLDGIKGLGDKKRDAIISLAPTLGDLEELRGKAGIAHKQFSEVLPKGVGSSLADEIEERIWSAMRKHQLAIEAAKAAVVDGGEKEDQPGEEVNSDDLP
jgi:hypothetical protein